MVSISTWLVEVKRKFRPAIHAEGINHLARRAIVLGLVCSVLLAAAVEAASQTASTTTGAISGTLADGTGAVLPGVTITLSSDALIGNGGTRKAVTNGEGLYRFPALPPGQYTLVFTLEGFRTVKREGIYIGVGFTATIDAKLDIAPLRDSVSLGRQIIDKQSTGIFVSFDARQLADLPNSRSMFAILAATPAVQVARIEVGGGSGDSGSPYSAYGTPARTGPWWRASGGGISATGFTLDYGSFEEVSVLTAAHGAEWSAPGVHMQFIANRAGTNITAPCTPTMRTKTGSRSTSTRVRSPWGARRRRAVAARGESRMERSRHQCRCWRLRQTRPALVVFLVPRPGRFGAAGELPSQTASNAFDELQRQRNVPSHREQQLRRVRPGGWNHQPNRLDPFGPVGGSLSAATAINESEERRQSSLRGAGSGKANGTRSSTRRSSSKFGLESSAPTVPTSRTAWPPASRTSAIRSSVAAIATGDEICDATRCSGPPPISRMAGSETTTSNSAARFFEHAETEIWRKGYPGDVLHVLRNDMPIEVYSVRDALGVGERLVDVRCVRAGIRGV